jgi:hypothetical protein
MLKRFWLRNLSGKHLCLLAIAMCLNIIAFSQQPITGTVIDSADRQPLAGISILVSGTSKGTQTNANGEYTITALPNSTLVFHATGYFEKRVVVGNQSIIDISLAASAQNLNDVVKAEKG